MINLVDEWGNSIQAADPGTGAPGAPSANPTGLPAHPGAGGGQSGYEGANDSSLRTSFLNFPRNARREISSFTRKELVRKQRALDANLGIFSRIKTKIGQHSVGKGIFVRPLTRDKKWNALNQKRFEARAENPLLYSTEETFDFYEDQRFAAETMIGDGEYFAGLVRKNGLPCVQRFDVFEIESPLGFSAGTRLPDGTLWQDGVRTDGYDAPRGYGVRSLPYGALGLLPASSVTDVPADSMMHVFRQRRAHQVRDLTWFYTGINNGIDALDTIALEKGAAKLHAALGLVVRKKTAEAGQGGISGALSKLVGTDGQPTRVDENFWRGAAVQYLAADEGIDLVTSDRPSPNLLAFLEFLYREIAIGLGIPLEVVYKLAELGGATARAALEDAQWLFDMVQDKIVMRHSRRYYIWDTAIAMQTGQLPVCEDPEWWASAWRGPAKLTVDLGRSADAAIKLMKNGALSHVRYYEERAQDAYQEVEEEIQFLAWLKKRCADADVDFNLLIEPTPGSVTNVHVQTPDDQ